MNKEDFNADYYFVRAMEHYTKFREYYYDNQLETYRPVTPNELSVDMLTHIITHLADEEVSYEAVFRKCVRSAQKRVQVVALEGLFYCKKCGVKARIPIEVSSTTDHIKLMKNGSFDIEAHLEMQNTEEVFTLNILATEDLLSACTCEEKEHSDSDWVNSNTTICVHLSDETVEYLKESVEKEENDSLLASNSKRHASRKQMQLHK